MFDTDHAREAVDELARQAKPPEFSELKRRATRRAQRRDATAIAAGFLGLVTLAGGLSAGGFGGADRLQTGSPAASVSAAPLASAEAFGAELEQILEQEPTWSTMDANDAGDQAFNGQCAGDWGANALGGGSGSPPGGGAHALSHLGFTTAVDASEAVAQLVSNLQSCQTVLWQVQPLSPNDAVLATTAGSAAWIQRTGDTVDILQVTTADGLPPTAVQLRVAQWLVAYRTWQEEQ